MVHPVYLLLPLLHLAAANGRLRFNAFDHIGCQGFEETYDLNPATVKGNFPGPRGAIQILQTSPGCHLTLYTGYNQSPSDSSRLGIPTDDAVCFFNGNGFEEYHSFGYYCPCMMAEWWGGAESDTQRRWDDLLLVDQSLMK